MSTHSHRLPVTVLSAPGEALDSYLTRTAQHNELDTAELTREIGTRAGTPLHNGRSSPTGAAPTPAILTAISTLVDQPVTSLQQLTLMHYVPDTHTGPGTVLPWRPTTATHICPACLSEHAIHQLWWHLPHATVCLQHQLLLHRQCPQCGKPFRSNRTPPLPDDLTHCDNTVATIGNTAVRCGYPLTELAPIPAAPANVATARILDAATNGVPQQLCGHPVDAADFLENVYAMVLLLSHLAVAGADLDRPWTEPVRADRARSAATATKLSDAPPRDMNARAAVFTEAITILTAEQALTPAQQLSTHFHGIPDDGAGPLNWLTGHTRETPLITELITAAIAPTRSISYQIAHLLPTTTLPAQAIPQCIPQPTYQRLFGGAFNVLDTTGCSYVSLCCARRLPGITDWRSAGAAIGIDANNAKQIPMNVSPHTTITAAALLERLDSVEASLDPSTDYRTREHAIQHLHAHRSVWFPQWRAAYYPLCGRDNGFVFACEWMWQQHCHGLPFSQPWSCDWNYDRRLQFHRWTTKLTAPAQSAQPPACTG